MTPTRARLTDALSALHWSWTTFATVCGVSTATVRRWCSEAYVIPPALLAWVERAAAWHRDNPAPPKPGRDDQAPGSH